jgi:hypothetical protein
MSTKNLGQWEGVGSYENLEIFMEDAKRLRSQAVIEMIGTFLTWTGRAFGNLTAPLVKKMQPALPTAGEARPGAAGKVRLMRTDVSAS